MRKVGPPNPVALHTAGRCVWGRTLIHRGTSHSGGVLEGQTTGGPRWLQGKRVRSRSFGKISFQEDTKRRGLLPETQQVLVHMTSGHPCWLGFDQDLQGHAGCFLFLGLLVLPQVMVILGVEPRHVQREGV